jgi:hypothetical protein
MYDLFNFIVGHTCTLYFKLGLWGPYDTTAMCSGLTTALLMFITHVNRCLF